MRLGRTIILAIFLMGTGCSNEQVYTAIQKNRQLECQKLPPAQYNSCMEEYDQDYEDYKREREEVINGKPR